MSEKDLRAFLKPKKAHTYKGETWNFAAPMKAVSHKKYPNRNSPRMEGSTAMVRAGNPFAAGDRKLKPSLNSQISGSSSIKWSKTPTRSIEPNPSFNNRKGLGAKKAGRAIKEQIGELPHRPVRALKSVRNKVVKGIFGVSFNETGEEHDKRVARGKARTKQNTYKMGRKIWHKLI